MENHEKIMKKSWNTMENQGKPWKTVENHGKPWKMTEPMTKNVMEHPGVALSATENG
jgi:deoxyribodipyrimidine photolyase